MTAIRVWCQECKGPITGSIWAHWQEYHPERLSEITKREGK